MQTVYSDPEREGMVTLSLCLAERGQMLLEVFVVFVLQIALVLPRPVYDVELPVDAMIFVVGVLLVGGVLLVDDAPLVGGVLLVYDVPLAGGVLHVGDVSLVGGVLLVYDVSLVGGVLLVDDVPLVGGVLLVDVDKVAEHALSAKLLVYLVRLVFVCIP